MKEIKLQQLKENYIASEGGKEEERQLTLREYVEIESENDPNFFRWFFDEELDEDFDSSLTDEQKEEFKEFLSTLPGYYTAFYNTETMKNVAYSLKAESIEEAISNAKELLGNRPMRLIQNDAKNSSESGTVVYNDLDK